MKSGPYNYYLPGKNIPRICEVEGTWVWFVDDDEPVPMDKCTGRFVRLVEQRETDEATPIATDENS